MVEGVASDLVAINAGEVAMVFQRDEWDRYVDLFRKERRAKELQDELDHLFDPE